MLGSVSPVVVAAREAVQDIAELYDGYHGDLVRELVIALQILDSQPGQLAQRRCRSTGRFGGPSTFTGKRMNIPKPVPSNSCPYPIRPE